MIIVDLACEQGHAFEAWFRSAEDFTLQREDGRVSCPVCGSAEIARTPSAPHLNLAHPGSRPPAVAQPAELAGQLAARLRAMASRARDVGARFPGEARRIHHGEGDQGSVRGQASRHEIASLLEEGIAVLPVPDDSELH